MKAPDKPRLLLRQFPRSCMDLLNDSMLKKPLYEVNFPSETWDPVKVLINANRAWLSFSVILDTAHILVSGEVVPENNTFFW